MLEYTAAYEGEDPVVTTPDGETLRPGDPRVAELFGAGVELVREAGTSHQDAGAVSLVGTASLRALGELLGDPTPSTYDGCARTSCSKPRSRGPRRTGSAGGSPSTAACACASPSASNAAS